MTVTLPPGISISVLRGVALSLIATAVFVVVVRLITWVRHLALARLRLAGREQRGVVVRGFTVVSARGILTFLRRTVEVLAWLLGLFTAYLWLAFVLTRFDYSRPWGLALGTYLRDTISEIVLSALGGIPGIFTVVLILVIARWVAGVVRAFFEAVEGGALDVAWVHPETASATKRIATALVWLLAVVAAYPYVPGSGSDAFKGVSVLAGLMISLGSSGVVNQVMSGIVLVYARALRPGDYVRVGDVEGTVTTLGILSTKIRTPRQEEVTLANALMVSSSLTNFSRLAEDGGVIVHTAVTIGYDAPWRQVHALLLSAAARTAGLRAEPAPYVLQRALSDFYVEYELNARLVSPEQRIFVLATLHEEIQDAFNAAGVQIMSPHFRANPAEPVLVPRERWYTPPAASPDGR